MDLSTIFNANESGTLTYEQFLQGLKAANIKLADLNEGNYVSKKKYEDEIAAKDKSIEELNGTISTRDVDLADLQKKLEEAGTDSQKLATLSSDFSTLQSKYENDVKTYKEQLKKQAYEFAVKDFASSKKFTSNAAKRDFIQSMIAKELKMEKDHILGAEDFVNAYSADNADAFVVESKDPEPAVPSASKPVFAAPTSAGSQTGDDGTGGFSSAFHFTEIHPRSN